MHIYIYIYIYIYYSPLTLPRRTLSFTEVRTADHPTDLKNYNTPESCTSTQVYKPPSEGWPMSILQKLEPHARLRRTARTPIMGSAFKRAHASHRVTLPSRVTPSSSVGRRIEDHPSPVKAWVFLSHPQRGFRLRSPRPRALRAVGATLHSTVVADLGSADLYI